jgi:hypothetical protein
VILRTGFLRGGTGQDDMQHPVTFLGILLSLNISRTSRRSLSWVSMPIVHSRQPGSAHKLRGYTIVVPLTFSIIEKDLHDALGGRSPYHMQTLSTYHTTATDASTVWGLGTLAGRAIEAFGEGTLREYCYTAKGLLLSDLYSLISTIRRSKT